MSVGGLLWPTGEEAEEEVGVRLDREELRALFTESQEVGDPDQPVVRRARRPVADRLKPWGLDSDRYQTWEGIDGNAKVLWGWLIKGKGRKLARAIGLVLEEDNPPRHGVPLEVPPEPVAVEVHSVPHGSAASPRGAATTDLVVESPSTDAGTSIV